MIEGKKLVSEIKALKMKYCNYWEEKPTGDNYSGAHGYMDMMLSEAIKYGFEQGESFGRYDKYAEKVMDKYLIQPENDRVWKEELDDIMKDCRSVKCHTDESKQVRLLGLIAEMILYRRQGD